MRQPTFPDESFERFRKPTRREKFLQEMEEVVPWKRLRKVIKPYYPKPGSPGRPAIGLDCMIRLYFLQHWFNLSDPAMEESVYDSRAMRKFVGIDLGREHAPDETTICKFRHLIEKHDLGPKLFAVVARHLQQEGNQWHFGMKAHIGVDSHTKLIHSAAVTAANVQDSQLLGDLMHGKELRVYGDSAYTGQGGVIRSCAPHAKDFTQKKSGASGFRVGQSIRGYRSSPPQWK